MLEDLLDNDDIKLLIECAGAKVVIGKTHGTIGLEAETFPFLATDFEY